MMLLRLLALWLPACAAHQSAFRSATAIVQRTVGGAAACIVPLTVAESLPEVRSVVYLAGSKPAAERAMREWERLCTEQWTLREASCCTGHQKLRESERICFFGSFVSAPALEELLRDQTVDLLVCDESSVHPAAAGAVRKKALLASHEGFFNAHRRLFLQLDGQSSVLQSRSTVVAASPAPGGVDDQCVVSESGSSCISTGEPMADAPPDDPWRGPVVRHFASAVAPRLTITASERVVSLSPTELSAVLEQSAAVRLPAGAMQPTKSSGVPYLTELALAALWIFCFDV